MTPLTPDGWVAYLTGLRAPFRYASERNVWRRQEHHHPLLGHGGARAVAEAIHRREPAVLGLMRFIGENCYSQSQWVACYEIEQKILKRTDRPQPREGDVKREGKRREDRREKFVRDTFLATLDIAGFRFLKSPRWKGYNRATVSTNDPEAPRADGGGFCYFAIPLSWRWRIHRRGLAVPEPGMITLDAHEIPSRTPGLSFFRATVARQSRGFSLVVEQGVIAQRGDHIGFFANVLGARVVMRILMPGEPLGELAGMRGHAAGIFADFCKDLGIEG